jgi:hypothetical protein
LREADVLLSQQSAAASDGHNHAPGFRPDAEGLRIPLAERAHHTSGGVGEDEDVIANELGIVERVDIQNGDGIAEDPLESVERPTGGRTVDARPRHEADAGGLPGNEPLRTERDALLRPRRLDAVEVRTRGAGEILDDRVEVWRRACPSKEDRPRGVRLPGDAEALRRDRGRNMAFPAAGEDRERSQPR